MGCDAHYDCRECDEANCEYELKWRKLLWLNHARYLPFEHTPYGDDGEMQCCGIDFKRASPDEIYELLIQRSLLVRKMD
jgi:hypothetical protein